MPSGKTHDAVTFILVAPTFAAAYVLTQNLPISSIVTAAFLFGGLMFGPDLDTQSKQYTRWSFFSFLWYPYKVFFKHRSRWSHGLIFGTFFRVVYFMGAITLLSFLLTFLIVTYSGGDLPKLIEFTRNWVSIGDFVRQNFGENAFPAVFVGLWLGAASHTLTDMAGSFIKHGRIMEPF
ncbi:MAG: metal-binding protein [Acidobacteriota bacterium]